MGGRWTDRTPFDAEDEEGNIYQLVEATDCEDAPVFGNPNNVRKGNPRYETADGQIVNRVGEDEFEIEDSFTCEKIRVKGVRRSGELGLPVSSEIRMIIKEFMEREGV